MNIKINDLINIEIYDTQELIELTKATKYQIWDLTRKNGYIKPFKKIKNKNYYSLHQLHLVKLWVECNEQLELLKYHMKLSIRERK